MSLTLAAAGAWAQPRFSPPKVDQAPQIDGLFAEGEWPESALMSELRDKVDGKAFPAATKVWTVIHGDSVYIAFSCESPLGEPVARSRQPNSQMDGEDVVAILIDPYSRRTNESMSSFLVNPFGTQAENLAGGRAAKREWRGEWQAAARIREGGWDVEIRIPWSILDRPAGTRDVQFNVGRYDSRLDRTGFWGYRDLRDLAEGDGILEGIELPAPDAKRQIDILGYGLAEYDKNGPSEATLRTGVDLRWKPTSQITGLISLNPDFRSIEQDVEQIGFTRTERSLNDARPFFTEGAGFFRASQGFSFGNLFYSRRIDDFDFGMKAFGNATERDQFGVLATREDGRRTDAIARWARQIDPRTSISAFTTYTGQPGSYASAHGINASWGRGNWGAGAQYAGSDRDGLSGGAASVYGEFQASRVFSILRWLEVGDNFRPPLALIPWRDRTGAYTYTSWDNPQNSGALRRWGLNAYAANFDTRGGGVQQRGFDLDGSLTTRNDIALQAGAGTWQYGNEHETEGRLGLRFNASNGQRNGGLFLAKGVRAGDGFQFLGADVNWRFGEGFDVGLAYNREEFQGVTEQSILGLGWEMNSAESISGRLVHGGGKLNSYLAYRRAGFKGLEYFVILGDPNAQETRTRAAVKVVWAK